MTLGIVLGLQTADTFARGQVLVTQTFRVAMAGETFEALSDGCQAAS